MDSPPPGPDRKAVEVAFHALLEKLRSDPAASRSFLTDQPEELRLELERMLVDYRQLLDAFSGSKLAIKRGRRLGEYELLAEIGRGGMGSVWEAEHRGLQRRVALKLLHAHLSLSPRSLERFRREALAGARLSHPGIVPIYETGEHEGATYLAMELVPGGFTLGDRIAEWREAPERGREHWRELAQLFHDIADALSYAHSLGVVHRDIKPGNILLSEEGRPRIADFGLAKLHDELAMSRTGEMTGTPYYMSPEQADGHGSDAGPQADVFALGVTMYEALTLQRPFDGESVTVVVEKILRADPRDPRAIRKDIPRDLASIALKAMEKKPAARYADARAMAEDLRRCLADEAVLAQPPGVAGKSARWVRRHPVWSSTIALAAIALGVFAWQFAEIRRAEELSSLMFVLTGRAVQIVDQRGIGLNRAEIIRGFEADVEELLPKLRGRAADVARLHMLRGQVRYTRHLEGALKDFNEAVSAQEDAPEIPKLERANIFFLAGMERMRAYDLPGARLALGAALKHVQEIWSSRDTDGHWDDPRVLDVAAQYFLALRRGGRRAAIAALESEYGPPERWMKARYEQLCIDRGNSDPSAIEAGSVLARWYFDKQTVGGENYSAKGLYEELEKAATATFGKADPRTLELRLMYLSAWERSSAPQAELRTLTVKLQEIAEEIERIQGKDNYLTLFAWRRVMICHIDRRETAAAVSEGPDLIERIEFVLGKKHIDAYDARTDYGIALAYEDTGRAIDYLKPLVDELVADGEIGPSHEATLIAMRALGLAYCAQEQHEECVDILTRAFELRGGLKPPIDGETVTDICDSLPSAIASKDDKHLDWVLDKLPSALQEQLWAPGADLRTSEVYRQGLLACLLASWKTDRHDTTASRLKELRDFLAAPPRNEQLELLEWQRGQLAEIEGDAVVAEEIYQRLVAAELIKSRDERDAYPMDICGQFLGRQKRYEEATKMFRFAIDSTMDKLQKRRFQGQIDALPRPEPAATPTPGR